MAVEPGQEHTAHICGAVDLHDAADTRPYTYRLQSQVEEVCSRPILNPPAALPQQTLF